MKSKMCRRIFTAAVAAVLASICVVLAVPITVLAHADLIRSDPSSGSVLQASPSRVVLWFTEAVDPQLSQIEVLDAANKRWDNGDTAVYQDDPSVLAVSLGTLPNGVYTVTWRNTSTNDGHVSAGSLVFYLGISASGAPVSISQAQPLLQSPVEPFLRWLDLLGVLAVMGCLVFEVFITRPVLTARNAPVPFAKMDVDLERRTLIMVIVAAAVCFAASLAELFVKSLSARSALSFMPLTGVIDVILQTYWGRMWVWRMVMLLAAIVVPGLALANWSPSRSGQRGWQIAGLGVFGAVLFSMSMVSHDAATLSIRPEAVFTDYLHLLAGSVWIGGIVYLAVVAPPAMRLYRRGLKNLISGPPCPAGHVSALGRFSFLALTSASVLLITGLYSSWAQVGVFRALATAYGIALCVKVGLALALAILGAVGLIWVRPRLSDDKRSLSVLKSTATAQAFLAIGIVLSVGFLVSLDPARQALASQGLNRPAISIKKSADWARITMQLEPGSAGPNTIVFLLRDSKGDTVDNASSVALQVSCHSSDLSTNLLYASPAGQGRYELQTDLPVAGAWQADVAIQTPGSAAVNSRFNFDISSSKATNGNPIAPSPGTGMILWAVELVAIPLALLPVWRLQKRFSRERRDSSPSSQTE